MLSCGRADCAITLTLEESCVHSTWMGERKILEYSIVYYLLTEEVGELCESYGVEVCLEGGENCRISGITCSQPGILRLIAALMRGGVTPVSLHDVVDDWVLQ
jgi:hypothetical protein